MTSPFAATLVMPPAQGAHDYSEWEQLTAEGCVERFVRHSLFYVADIAAVMRYYKVCVRVCLRVV